MIEDDEFADFEKHDNAREPSIKGGGHGSFKVAVFRVSALRALGCFGVGVSWGFRLYGFRLSGLLGFTKDSGRFEGFGASGVAAEHRVTSLVFPSRPQKMRVLRSLCRTSRI